MAAARRVFFFQDGVVHAREAHVARQYADCKLSARWQRSRTPDCRSFRPQVGGGSQRHHRRVDRSWRFLTAATGFICLTVRTICTLTRCRSTGCWQAILKGQRRVGPLKDVLAGLQRKWSTGSWWQKKQDHRIH
jgi:hypothetical protein